MWRLPMPLKRGLFWGFGQLLIRTNSTGYQQLRLNLGRVVQKPADSPEVHELARQATASSMRYYRDIFDLVHWNAQQIRTRVVTHNDSYLRDAAKKTGVILALPHTGNWDLAGAWCAIEVGKLSTVAERLRPEGVFEKFVAMRKAIGISILPLSGGGSTYEWLRSEALRGQIVPLLSDRDVAKNGSSVNFFGHPAKLPFGAALLAVDTKLPLITCATYYIGDTLHIDFDPPIYSPPGDFGSIERIRVAKGIQEQICQNLSAHIATRPESWQMMSPIWPDLVVQQS